MPLRRIEDNGGQGHCGPLSLLISLHSENPAHYASIFGDLEPRSQQAIERMRTLVVQELQARYERYFPAVQDNQWNHFIAETQKKAWFNHVSMQAAANALSVNITMLESTWGWQTSDLKTTAQVAKARIWLGHIGTNHFVSLLKLRKTKDLKRPRQKSRSRSPSSGSSPGRSPSSSSSSSSSSKKAKR